MSIITLISVILTNIFHFNSCLFGDFYVIQKRCNQNENYPERREERVNNKDTKELFLQFLY